ncbi:MAG: hypothetical protein ACM3ST_01375 [Bdellovibrio bacteriovorus]
MIDTAGEPMRVGRASWLDQGSSGGALGPEGADRLAALLLPAIREAMTPLNGLPQREKARIVLMLALPPDRPGGPPRLAETLLEAVGQQLPEWFVSARAYACGHAAGHLALGGAIESLNGATFEAALVAGVDSYLAPETLEWLESCDQLHGAGPLNNAWGFIPGEAAAALLLVSPREATRWRLDVLGEVAGLGIAQETKLIKTDAVCIGEGLTAALRAALGGLAPGELVHNCFCDMNGETYRADEFGFASLRTRERFRSATDFVAPADCWGDIGAAGMPLHSALALIAHRKRYGKGPISLVWASSESGERGAVLLRGLDPRRD